MVASRVIQHLVSPHFHPARCLTSQILPPTGPLFHSVPTTRGSLLPQCLCKCHFPAIPPDIARTYSLTSFKSLPKYHFPSEAILTILSKLINYKSPRLLIFPTPLCFFPTSFLSPSHVSYGIYFCLLHRNVNSLMPRGMLSFAHC